MESSTKWSKLGYFELGPYTVHKARLACWTFWTALMKGPAQKHQASRQESHSDPGHPQSSQRFLLPHTCWLYQLLAPVNPQLGSSPSCSTAIPTRKCPNRSWDGPVGFQRKMQWTPGWSIQTTYQAVLTERSLLHPGVSAGRGWVWQLDEGLRTGWSQGQGQGQGQFLPVLLGNHLMPSSELGVFTAPLGSGLLGTTCESQSRQGTLWFFSIRIQEVGGTQGPSLETHIKSLTLYVHCS
jgi:hypothetical protein